MFPEIRAHLPSRVGRCFDLMDVAEEEIKAAQERHADSADKIHASFKLLCPSEAMSEKHQDVYRAHCREILNRVAAGNDTKLGTKAEAMVGLADASLAFPLGQIASALYHRLFGEVFGSETVKALDLGGVLITEPWPGASDELLSDLVKQAAQDDRA